MAVLAGRTPLIGRSQELVELLSHLSAARGRVGGAVLLSGEAGIGKSRLVAEARASAERDRFAVLEGACFEPDRSLPYAPILDLLWGLIAGQDATSVAALLGATAPDLVTLLPELAGRLDAVSRHPALDPEQEKRRLFEALTTFLIHHAAGEPLLVILEDLHWSDDTSLEFLLTAVRRLAPHPILLLLTYRNDELHPSLSYLLAELDRYRLITTISLTRLSLAEAEAMIRAVRGQDQRVRADVLDALYGLTEGNPFFIEEVLKSLAPDGDIFYAGAWAPTPLAELRVPHSIQDAVRRRLAQLSKPARETISLAAVAGRRFDFALLQDVTDRDETDLLHVIRELVTAQLVVEESADRFAFRHALTQQAVSAEMLSRERRALHGRIAGAIERRAATMPEMHLDSLAFHTFEAGDWEQALNFARAAGERARAMYAPRVAVAHLTRALEAAQQLSLSPPLDLYRTRALAHETLGNFEQSRADHGTALILAQTAGDRREEWQALLDLGFLWASRDYEQAGDYWQRALVLARTMDDAAKLAGSLNRVGNWYVNRCETEAGARYHDEALAILQGLDDQRGVAETLDLLGMARLQGGDLLRAAAFYERAIAAFDALDLRLGAASSRTVLALSRGAYCMEIEVWPETSFAEQVSGLEAAIRITREIGWRAGESFALKMLSWVLGPRGRYGRALAATHEGLAIAEEIEHRQWILANHVALGMLYRDLFALEAARPHLQRALAMATETGSRIWICHSVTELADLHRAEHDLARAASVLDAVDTSQLQSNPERRVLRARAELALAQHEPDRALRLVEQLIASAANVSPERIIPRLWTVRGEALAALERPAEAETAFVAAKEVAERRGMRPLLLRLHAAIGRLYQRGRRPAEAEQSFAAARMTIDNLALDVPDEPVPALGGASLRDWFVREATAFLPRSRALTPLRAAKQEFDGLTSREREVATLIAGGCSNREIAETLVVSERTVETHVGSILAKLSLDSRRQVANWAADKGLTLE
ncbi:MAG: helix-turn-helix transcriptional regulator, partial [Dehalococcoidia bacterium]